MKSEVSDASSFVSGGPECLVFTLLAIQQRIAHASQVIGPNTPSAAIPPFAKPPAKPKNRKGKKKRGGQSGHTGRTREPLPEPDRTREHILPCCPDCHGPLKRTGDKRTRRSEDILHRDYCSACQKRVEPKLPDVLPRCTLGNRTLVLSAMLHFLQGLTLGQIVGTFNFHLRMKVTPGGLVQMWHRLADLLFSWYEQIHSEILGECEA